MTLYQVHSLVCEESILSTRITGETPQEITAQQQARWEANERQAWRFVDNELMRCL